MYHLKVVILTAVVFFFFSIDSHIKCNTNDKREPTRRTSTDGAIPVYLFTFLDETNWLGNRMFNLI